MRRLTRRFPVATLRTFALAGALSLFACATSGFHIERVASTGYSPSRTVVLIVKEPQQPYTVIATFSGTELALCALDEPYCSLRAPARELGADAVWVQQVHRWTRPEQWVDIDGRMTRIRPSEYESLEGVFIRYRH